MDEDASGETKKARKELPAGAVATLKAWLLAPEHFTHPYPSPQEQAMLMQKTGVDSKQLKNWFTNARRRIWKPMLKKQLEEGKLVTDGAGGGLVAMPPGRPSGAAAAAAAAAASAAALVQQLQPNQPHVGAPTTDQIGGGPPPYNVMAPTDGNALAMQLQCQQALQQQPVQMINGDSHAVLMELFARDQDLVRQAMEGAKLKAQAALQLQLQQQPQQQPQQDEVAAVAKEG